MDEELIKQSGDPRFQKFIEDRLVWRTTMLNTLAAIRTEQDKARSVRDNARVDRLEAEYKQIVDLLARN